MKNLFIGAVFGALLAFLVLKLIDTKKKLTATVGNDIAFDSSVYKLINEKASNYGYVTFKKMSTDMPKKVLSHYPIELDKAIEFIKSYNEIHNPDLFNTCFVEFKRSEVMTYLTDADTWIKKKNPSDKSDILRIYLGDRGDNTKSEISLIMTVANKDEELCYETGENQLKARDWGGLRPPVNSPKELKNDDPKPQLLFDAIDKSSIIYDPRK